MVLSDKRACIFSLLAGAEVKPPSVISGGHCSIHKVDGSEPNSGEVANRLNLQDFAVNLDICFHPAIQHAPTVDD